MTFDEVLKQAKELLREQKRTSYRGLKRRFDLDDEYLEDLKAELIGALRLAVDEDGHYLVWIDAAPVSSSKLPVSSSTQPLAPNPQLPTRHPTSPNASARSKRRWKRGEQQTASARPSRPCSPISKARRR